MNKCARLVAALMFLGAASGVAQTPSHLTTLGDNIVASIQGIKTDWKYEPVPPMKGSDGIILQQWTDGVLLQQWTLEDESVRISIVRYESTDHAAKAMADLARDGSVRETVQGLGDEGFSWGRGTVSFRRRDLTIHVSAVVTKPTLDLKLVAENVKKERQLCKEFARLVAEAIRNY